MPQEKNTKSIQKEDRIVFCWIHQAACKHISCKHGEPIIEFSFEQDSYELKPREGEMTPEQEDQFWKGKRFFKPVNPRWWVRTNKGCYSYQGYPNKTMDGCADYKE